ncbi:MAG TPA: lysine 2,3-aminomutase [Caldisericia bacterium]|nr:lysine 2,3-aminomutase [Caldisericia bacterium]
MRDYREIELWKNVEEEEWNDWRWQLRNRVMDLDTLKKVVNLTPFEEEGVKSSLRKLRMAITPYWITLIDKDNPDDPIRKQAIPTIKELEIKEEDIFDPLFEEVDSPVKGLTHRYPDRVLFLITDQCGMYCRHCTRRRFAGEKDKLRTKEELMAGIEYIREHSEINDVLLSGGDALLVSDNILELIIKELRKIPHVDVIRIGTRAPCTLPMRITDELVEMLKKYHPIWLNTQFNHYKEITDESKKAILKLVDAGIPVGNQSVLLKGINDCPIIQKKLVNELVKIRVRPYYLYQCDLSQGISHFRTSIGKGIEIIENLRGHVSGFKIPTYIVDTLGGGKIPVFPDYLISMSDRKVILRNYEGGIFSYTEPIDKISYCPENCDLCIKEPHLESKDGPASMISGKRLLIEPIESQRIKRRNGHTTKHHKQ